MRFADSVDPRGAEPIGQRVDRRGGLERQLDEHERQADRRGVHDGDGVNGLRGNGIRDLAVFKQMISLLLRINVTPERIAVTHP